MVTNENRVILNEDKYPGNSIKKRKEEPERVKKKPIVIAKRIKKPFYKRFANAFMDEGSPTGEVGSYVLHDVIVPAAKTTIADLIEGAIDMLLFGNDNHRRRSKNLIRRGSRSLVPYNSLYERDDPRHRGHSDPRSRSSRARHDFSDIVLGSRGEAEAVLDELLESIATYDVVSVGDLYDVVGLSSEYTDNKYGWTELAGAGVSRVREGWVLDLPRPIVID